MFCCQGPFRKFCFFLLAALCLHDTNIDAEQFITNRSTTLSFDSRSLSLPIFIVEDWMCQKANIARGYFGRPRYVYVLLLYKWHLFLSLYLIVSPSIHMCYSANPLLIPSERDHERGFFPQAMGLMLGNKQGRANVKSKIRD
jgi:hypothetical protein